jgi:hypothetical protein
MSVVARTPQVLENFKTVYGIAATTALGKLLDELNNKGLSMHFANVLIRVYDTLAT